MGLLDSLIPGLGAVSSIFGLVSSADQARQQQAQQQALFNQATQQINSQYNNQLGLNQQNLYSMAGQGGDAITAMGRQMGDQMANAGVFNSTGVAGALGNAQRNEMGQIGAAGTQLQNSAWQQRQGALLGLTQQQLGANEQNLGYARQQYGNAAQGFGNYVGQLGQVLGQQQPQQQGGLIDPSGNGSYNGTPGANIPPPGYMMGGGGGAPNMMQPGSGGDAITQSIQQQVGAPMQAQPQSNYNLFQSPNNSGLPNMFQPQRSAQQPQPNGVMSHMGSVGQHNLMTSGANAYRPQLPTMNGTMNQGANLGGNAGYSNPMHSMGNMGMPQMQPHPMMYGMQRPQGQQFGAAGIGGNLLGR